MRRRTIPGVAVGLLLSVLVVWALVVVIGGLSIPVAALLGNTVSAGVVALGADPAGAVTPPDAGPEPLS